MHWAGGGADSGGVEVGFWGLGGVEEVVHHGGGDVRMICLAMVVLVMLQFCLVSDGCLVGVFFWGLTSNSIPM